MATDNQTNLLQYIMTKITEEDMTHFSFIEEFYNAILPATLIDIDCMNFFS